MRLKEGFELINRQNQFGVVSKNNPQKFIPLSEIAVFLWKLIEEKQATKSDMLQEVLNNFDISTVLALGEIDLFLRMMREDEIIE